jgi:membrane associated rhomboid family serine protease
MTTAPATTCYRHPDRETGRHCTRCGRPACPECLLNASVGSHCIDCVKAAAPGRATRVKRVWRGDALLATKVIIGINIAAFVAIGIADQRWDGLGHTSANYALYGPLVHNGDWYRLFTYSVVHFGFLHIFFNLLVLWMVGRVLEPGAGHLRFALLYVVSVLGGAAGALIMSPHAPTGGASGGVFGVATAATIVLYRQGVRFWDTGFGPLLLINLIAVPLVVSNVSVGGHIGGLIAGGLATEGMVQARKAGQPALGWVAAAFVGVGAFLICLAVAGNT